MEGIICVCGKALEPLDGILEPCKSCTEETRTEGYDDGYEAGTENGRELEAEDIANDNEEKEEIESIQRLMREFDIIA